MVDNQTRRVRPAGVFLACGLLALVFAGCGSKAQQSFERPPAPVQVAEAISQDVPIYLDAIGKIVAREVVFIKPQVSGRITNIHFTDGVQCEEGPIAVYDRSPAVSSESQAGASQLVANCSSKEAGRSQSRPRNCPGKLGRVSSRALWKVG